MIRLYVLFISAFLIFGTKAMSQTCTFDTFQKVRRQVEQMENAPAIEILRLRDSAFSEQTFPTPKGEILSFFAECNENDNQPIEVGFLFAIDTENRPTYGEAYIFLNGKENFEYFPFSGDNYVSEESAFIAATRYLNDFRGSIDVALHELQSRGFFVHNDYIDEEHQRHVVIVREPYPRNSLMDRIGGNRSPNIPASFCMTASEQFPNNIRISRTSECRFDWASYVDQANEILRRELANRTRRSSP